MKVVVEQEALRSIIDGDTETLQLNLGIEMTATVSEKGAITELRKNVEAAITGLVGLMKDAKKEARGETEILVEMTQPTGKPYRTSVKTFGDDVPGFEWSKSNKKTPAGG